MEIRDRKAAQRRAGIMARRDLPQAERAAANAAICARLLAMPCFQKAENLLLYAAFGGEVDLAVLAEQAARLSKTVAYPVCGGKLYPDRRRAGAGRLGDGGLRHPYAGSGAGGAHPAGGA